MKLNRFRLRRERKEHRWTIKEAADRIGVSKHTLASWETAKRSPSEFNLEKICEVFGLTKEDLTDTKA